MGDRRRGGSEPVHPHRRGRARRGGIGDDEDDAEVAAAEASDAAPRASRAHGRARLLSRGRPASSRCSRRHRRGRRRCCGGRRAPSGGPCALLARGRAAAAAAIRGAGDARPAAPRVRGTFALTRETLHFLPTSEHMLEGARERCWGSVGCARRSAAGTCCSVQPSSSSSRRRRLRLHLVFFSFATVDERREAQTALLSQPLSGLLPGHPRRVDATAPSPPDTAPATRAWQEEPSPTLTTSCDPTPAGRTY